MNRIPNRIRNETVTAWQRLCSSNNDVELFTQYRFKATIGQLPRSTIERQGEPTDLNGGTPTPPTTRMKRAPRGI